MSKSYFCFFRIKGQLVYHGTRFYTTAVFCMIAFKNDQFFERGQAHNVAMLFSLNFLHNQLKPGICAENTTYVRILYLWNCLSSSPSSGRIGNVFKSKSTTFVKVNVKLTTYAFVWSGYSSAVSISKSKKTTNKLWTWKALSTIRKIIHSCS